jgi:HlyD family secretion protein
VPTEALVDGSRVYVFDPDEGLIELREVKTGTSNWDHTEILEGLVEHELVVTSVGREGLADGVAARQETNAAQ